MRITQADLDEAAKRGLISSEQAASLGAFLAERHAQTPSFRPAHILYYLGGMIAIGSMTLFMTLGWEQFGGAGLLGIAMGYGLGASLLTEHLLKRRQLPLPAGITAVLAVAVVPLAVYGAQQAMGLWPADDSNPWAYREYHTHIDGRWLLMELATLAAGVWALSRWRLPFLVMPVAVTLWYMSMDLVPVLLGAEAESFFSEAGRRISMFFGLAMLVLAWAVDIRSRPPADPAFWLYGFGLLTFWGGLTSLEASSELARLGYAAINLLLIAVGAILVRRAFAVFGGTGLALYLAHLAYAVFHDSLLFPLALTATGLCIIAGGIQWQRHEQALGNWLRQRVPPAWRRWMILDRG